ncbi:hypothetical protein PS838_01448 [Pseudomonas fluorescens]|nr:hypothetical protein PS838_01448 [Pseudomonas fluorescens]
MKSNGRKTVVSAVGRRELCISISLFPSSLYLVDDRGLPVWPISSNEELRAIEHFSSAFDIALTKVSCSPGHSNTQSAGMVGCIGGKLELEAMLYAHLTGRTLVVFTASTQAEQCAELEVLVADIEQLDDVLLQELCNPMRSSVVGIICAYPGVSIRTQILVRAATASLVPKNTVAISICPPQQNITIHSPGSQSRSNSIDSFKSSTILSEGCAYLGITTHSDGVDAFLGGNEILCSYSLFSMNASVGLEKLPRCLKTGYCHRFGGLVSDAVASHRLIPSKQTKAWVFYSAVCWGVILTTGATNHNFALGRSFIESPTVGAYLTTWKANVISPSLSESIAQSMLGGAQLGEAMLCSLRTSTAMDRGTKFVLFGDPRIKIVELVSTVRKNKNTKYQKTGESSALPLSVTEGGPMEFIKLCVLIASSRCLSWNQDISERILIAWDEMLPLLKERYVYTSADEYYQRGAKLLGCIAEATTILSDLWAPFATWRKGNDNEICNQCKTPRNKPTTLLAHFPKPLPTRVLVSCSVCGLSIDTPLCLEMNLSFNKENVVTLEGAKSLEPWAGIFILKSQLPSESMILNWPKCSISGHPIERLALPTKLPEGPLDACLLLLSPAGLSVMGMRRPAKQ